MPEFLTLLPPDAARGLLLAQINAAGTSAMESIKARDALGRVTAVDVISAQPLPEFPRSTVDGYAVRARDTFGASDTLPGYLKLIGEVPMGSDFDQALKPGECALIHTGGMLPQGADAALMIEYTQLVRPEEIEIQRAVADGENVIRVGEDVARGQVVIPRGTRIRAAEIGGLMALGIMELQVAARIKVGLISSGDEVIAPELLPHLGQVRDINSHTLAALVTKAGGDAIFYGIVPDRFEDLRSTAARALQECELVLITAGSSASIRDMTADVINTLGEPGVLVHGINTRPGKPTILGVCAGKPVIGLPGNPVSALVNGLLFVVPAIEKMLGLAAGKARPSVRARLTVNLASQAGREDWQPVRLVMMDDGWQAEPIFGKSNLIFSLAAADGLIKIHADANGMAAGEIADVFLMD